MTLIEHRLIVAGPPAGGAAQLRGLSTGDRFSLGREGDIPLGAEPKDLRLSRLALGVTATYEGWTIEVSNSAGAWVQPWMSQRRFVESGESLQLRRPRICVDLVGGKRHAHRVLLEHDRPPATPIVLAGTIVAGTVLGASGVEGAGQPTLETAPANMLRPLTPEQIAAVRAVFSGHLTWPPLEHPVATTIAAAARSLAIDGSTLKDRLKRARERVAPYGFGSCRLTDPEYVYALVDVGLITFTALT